MSGPSTDDLLISELHAIYKKLGGTQTDDLRTVWRAIDAIMCWNPPIELRYVLGSYGDTLEDKEVLRLLKDWNETGKILHQPQ